MSRHPRIKFFLEKRKDKKTGEIRKINVPIRFSVSAGFYFKSTTGILIDEDLWDSDKQRVKSSHTHSARLNKELSKLRTELETLCYDAWDKKVRLTADYISSNLLKNQRSERGFFSRFEEFIDEGRKKWQPGTIKKFVTIRNHLMDFGEKKRVRIEFDEMDEKFLNKLLDYYFEETKEKSAYLNTYVRKNIKFIKHFLTWATEKGFNKNREFEKWRLDTGQKKEDPIDNIISLTIAEFLQIYKKEFESEAMQRTKDYLVLACSTGLRFSDIANLKRSDIDYIDGIISCTTIKTGSKTQIPFNEFSRGILEKYRITPNYSLKGVEMAFPTISNQKTNNALKELGKLANLNTMVTKIHYRRNQRIEKVCPKHELISTHIGRKTFITINIWLGLKSEILMGLTTHKSHETMENYYSIDLEMKRKAMANFNIKALQSIIDKSHPN